MASVFLPGGLSAATVVHTSQNDFSSGTFTGWGSVVGAAGDVRMGLSGAEVLPGFSTTTVLPAARFGHAMAVWNGRFYVTGGYDSGFNPQDTVYSAPINADGSVGSWTTEANVLPAARYGHAMSAWNGRLYVTGGKDSGNVVKDTVYSAPINADGSVGTWTTEANVLPAARGYHAMSVWNGRLYVTGGADSGSNVKDIVYSAPINANGSVGSWTTEVNVLPAARNAHAMAVWNDRLYVAGGVDSIGSVKDSVYSAPINADGSVGPWTTEVNSLPAVRSAHAMSVWNGRLYVTGGNVLGVKDTVYSAPINADGSVGSWTTESNVLPAARDSHAMSVWNGRLYVTGGENNGAKDTVYFASVNSEGAAGSWTTQTNSLPAVRYGHAASVWNGRLYVSGGWDGGATASTVYSAPINSAGNVGSWTTETNALPNGLYYHAMSVWNGRLYITGGNLSGGASWISTILSASLNADGSVGSWTTEVSTLPAGRYGHAMAAWRGRLYVTGGYDGSMRDTVYSAPLNADGSVGSWTTEANVLPGTRRFHAMTVWNGRLYVAGGSDNSAVISSTVFSASLNADGSVGSWTTETNSLPAAREYPAMTVWNGRLYAVGGASGTVKDTVYSAPLNADGSVGTWTTETNSLPAVRYALGLSLWNGRLYATGGANSGVNPTSTVYSMGVPFYSSTATYYGPVVDLGSAQIIDSVAWTQSAAPAGSSIAVYLATAVTSGQALSTFTAVSNGGVLNAVARYAQYRIDMVPGGSVGSPARDQTPVIDDVTITYSDPLTPSGVTATVLGVSSITWSWSDVSGETGYRVLSQSDANLSGDLAAGAVSWTETGLSTNTAYTRKVAALFADVKTTTSSAVTGTTLAAPPAAFAATNVFFSSAVFSWNANGNPAGTIYLLQTNLDGGGNYSTALTTTSTGPTLTGLTPGTTYYLRVLAQNLAGTPTTVGPTLSIYPRQDQSTFTLDNAQGGTGTISPVTGDIQVTFLPNTFSGNVTITLQVPVDLPGLGTQSFAANVTGTGVGVEVTVSNGEQPGKNVTIVLHYRAADVAGLNENLLVVARYDPQTASWIPLPSTVDAADDRVTAVTDHLSVFQVMAKGPAASVSGAKVFPNPFRPATGHTGLTFANLPANAAIKIYTPVGALVRELIADAAGEAAWDAKDQDGKSVDSGVYFVLAQGAGGKKTFKVVIQR